MTTLLSILASIPLVFWLMVTFDYYKETHKNDRGLWRYVAHWLDLFKVNHEKNMLKAAIAAFCLAPLVLLSILWAKGIDINLQRLKMPPIKTTIENITKIGQCKWAKGALEKYVNDWEASTPTILTAFLVQLLIGLLPLIVLFLN